MTKSEERRAKKLGLTEVEMVGLLLTEKKQVASVKAEVSKVAKAIRVDNSKQEAEAKAKKDKAIALQHHLKMVAKEAIKNHTPLQAYIIKTEDKREAFQYEDTISGWRSSGRDITITGKRGDVLYHVYDTTRQRNEHGMLEIVMTGEPLITFALSEGVLNRLDKVFFFDKGVSKLYSSEYTMFTNMEELEIVDDGYKKGPYFKGHDYTDNRYPRGWYVDAFIKALSSL